MKRRRSRKIDRLDAAICEVMNREVVSVHADVGIDTLEELMLERELSGVPVIDDSRRLVGYVAMTDIVRALHDRVDRAEESAETFAWGFHTEPAPPAVSEVMSAVAFELQQSCSVARAIELMTAHHVHRVPVVSEDGVLVGIVSASDVMRFVARGKEAPRKRAPLHPTEAERMAALGFLAAGLAHQVNNALTPMRLTLGRLTSFELSRRPMSDERLHRIELLQDLREGLACVERIVRELRTFAHTGDATAGPLEIADELEVAIGFAAHEIKHRARLVRDYNPTPRVAGRAVDLRQVFLSLLINAVHAIPDGAAHVHEIRVRTSTDERGFAIVEIEDTGKGIGADALPRIFEPFFTTHPGSALGIGLAVTRDLVSALGGQIAVDSVVGRGTRVHVALPACDTGARVEPPSVTESSDPAAAGKRLRILIVDDDRPVAAAIALELDQHDVVIAESGREALHILSRDKSFDVILCDLMMPDVSGMDVYEAVRLVDPHLLPRIVLMTGGGFTARAQQFLSTLDTPLLEKPFEPGELHAIVGGLVP